MTTENTQDVGREILARVEAMTADLSDAQKEQARALAVEEFEKNAETIVQAEVERRMADKSYRADVNPDSTRALEGTVYGRMGYTMSDVELVHDLLDASHRSTFGAKPGPNEATRKIVEAARSKRAMDTAESGFGAQLVADAEYVPEIWETARERYGRIGGLIESRTMSGPVEKQPVLAAIPEMIFVGENTAAATDSTLYGTQKVGSNEVTLTAKKFLAHYNYSGEMVEDSIVPFVPLLRTSLAMAQGRLMDKLALNGDTTNAGTGNINLDDADPADTLYYLAADGIRHAALVDNTGNALDHGGGALTWANLMKLPTLMLDRTYDRHWGRPDDPNDLVFCGTPELDNDLLNLDEVVAAAAGAGRLPADAGLNGELTRLGRYPYVSTTAMALTEADGKVSTTAGNNTLGQIVAFNPKGFMWGVRRAAQIEVERIPRSDQWAIVLSTRVAFTRLTPTGAASGIEAAAALYNISNG